MIEIEIEQLRKQLLRLIIHTQPILPLFLHLTDGQEEILRINTY